MSGVPRPAGRWPPGTHAGGVLPRIAVHDRCRRGPGSRSLLQAPGVRLRTLLLPPGPVLAGRRL